MKTVTFKLPEFLDAKLSALARKRGRSKSEIMREAIERYLDSCEKKPEVSCYDLVKEFAGCYEGPGDASTNPKYLDDYGK